MDVLLESEPLPGMAQLVLNRPHIRNALDPELIARLRDRLAYHAARAQTRVVVLRATGAAFCAGVELRTMREQGQSPLADNEADARALAALFAALRGLPKPTVVAVQGPTLGAGVGLVAACDVAIGAEEAKFCLPEVRLGIVPALAAPYLIEAIGLRQVRRYALSGEMMSAVRAQELGLLHEVVPTLALGGEALRLASDLLQGGPQALAECKDLFTRTGLLSAGEQRDVALASVLARLRASAEALGGLAAMIARRPPPWAP